MRAPSSRSPSWRNCELKKLSPSQRKLILLLPTFFLLFPISRIDSNKLMYLPHGALHGLNQLVAVKLDKNPWHCDCRALYLARWIREFVVKLWDGQQPMCRGPGDLGGHEVGLLRYDDLCDGQWASMLSLSPRLPVRTHRISTPMNYTDYFNLYLKHIYNSTTDEQLKEAEITSVAIKKVHVD